MTFVFSAQPLDCNLWRQEGLILIVFTIVVPVLPVICASTLLLLGAAHKGILCILAAFIPFSNLTCVLAKIDPALRVANILH
jgi:hypothetical protein